MPALPLTAVLGWAPTSIGTLAQEDIVYDGVINQHEQQAEPNVQSQAGLSAAPLDAFAKRR
mgnify:CR=1 FL=1